MSIIFGAGGVAKEVAWLLHAADGARGKGSAIEFFVSADADWRSGWDIDGVPVVAESAFIAQHAERGAEIYVAIGQPSVRTSVVKALERHRPQYPTLIHPTTSFDKRPGKLTVGHGVVIYPHVSLSTEVVIGSFVHVNPGTSIAHHVNVGDFTTVCPGAVIAGCSSIGNRCFIGAGAVVRDGIRIADVGIIGAGAVVVSDVNESGTWIGIPARRHEP
jgi:sugar O-acyltransferase (sialic acid O-acetyltransferase NeuD family)